MRFDLTDAADYIAAVRWQFASAMPHWPHEYTLRRWRSDLDPEFAAMVRLIREKGVAKPWRSSAQGKAPVSAVSGVCSWGSSTFVSESREGCAH